MIRKIKNLIAILGILLTVLPTLIEAIEKFNELKVEPKKKDESANTTKRAA